MDPVWQRDFTCFGRTFRLETEVDELMEAVRAIIPPRAQRTTDTPTHSFKLLSHEAGFAVNVNWEITWHGDDPHEAVNQLESELSFELCENTPGLAFVHAGVVAFNGHVAVFPGRSFFGKSTLTRALLAAGATYFSDEYAVIDAQGMVHPYPRSLAIRLAGQWWAHRIPCAAFGAKEGNEPLPLGVVIATQYQPGTSWQPRRLSTGRTAMAMFEHALSARTQPEMTLNALHTAATTAVGWAGPRGEADETARRILERMTS
jgi:hypothetical protein